MFGLVRRVLYGRGGGSGGGALPFSPLLIENFITNLASPLSTPHTSEPGPGTLKLTQVDGSFKIIGERLTILPQATPVFGDLGAVDSTVRARVPGLAAILNIYKPNTTTGPITGWVTSQSLAAAVIAGYAFDESAGVIYGIEKNAAVASNLGTTSANTNYYYAVVARSSGEFLFIKGGAFAAWTLLMVSTLGSQANIYPAFFFYDTYGYSDYFYLCQLSSPFNSDFGIATQHLLPPITGTNYISSADAIIQFQVTAPASITTNVEIRYRVQDANNYWTAYFNTAGALRVDSVSGGTPTNRVNVAGVIAANGTVTICVNVRGNLHTVSTLNGSLASGTLWTDRLVALNNSFLNTQTTITPVIGAGWVSDQLDVYPKTDPSYDTALNAPINTYASISHLLVFDGDSLTSGAGPAFGNDYPEQTLVSLGNGFIYQDFGIGGQTLATMVANASAKIDPLFRAGGIVIIWGGINDLGGGTSAATLLSYITTYGQARQAAGWKVIVLDIIKAGTLSGAQETERVSYNASVASGWASFANAFVQVSANAAFSNTSDTTYYNADTVHLTAVGYGVVAGLVVPAIQGLL